MTLLTSPGLYFQNLNLNLLPRTLFETLMEFLSHKKDMKVEEGLGGKRRGPALREHEEVRAVIG